MSVIILVTNLPKEGLKLNDLRHEIFLLCYESSYKGYSSRKHIGGFFHALILLKFHSYTHYSLRRCHS